MGKRLLVRTRRCAHRSTMTSGTTTMRPTTMMIALKLRRPPTAERARASSPRGGFAHAGRGVARVAAGRAPPSPRAGPALTPGAQLVAGAERGLTFGTAPSAHPPAPGTPAPSEPPPSGTPSGADARGVRKGAVVPVVSCVAPIGSSRVAPGARAGQTGVSLCTTAPRLRLKRAPLRRCGMVVMTHKERTTNAPGTRALSESSSTRSPTRPSIVRDRGLSGTAGGARIARDLKCRDLFLPFCIVRVCLLDPGCPTTLRNGSVRSRLVPSCLRASRSLVSPRPLRTFRRRRW